MNFLSSVKETIVNHINIKKDKNMELNNDTDISPTYKITAEPSIKWDNSNRYVNNIDNNMDINNIDINNNEPIEVENLEQKQDYENINLKFIGTYDIHLQEQDEQLDNILKDVKEIKEISIDMSDILLKQDNSLNTIELNTDNTNNNMKKADNEINKAIKYKKDGQINVVGVTTGAIVGSFFGPIGATVGAGIGLIGSATVNLIR